MPVLTPFGKIVGGIYLVELPDHSDIWALSTITLAILCLLNWPSLLTKIHHTVFLRKPRLLRSAKTSWSIMSKSWWLRYTGAMDCTLRVGGFRVA